MKKRLISLLLVLGIMLGCSTMAFASDGDNKQVCTQFSYFVVDKDGNIIETGITPDFSVSTRATWSGITLSNGATAYFRPANNNSGFYIVKDSYIEFEFMLDRAASGTYGIMNGLGGISTDSSFRNDYGHTPVTPVFNTGYYYGFVKSAYDGDFVITSAEFTWQ